MHKTLICNSIFMFMYISLTVMVVDGVMRSFSFFDYCACLSFPAHTPIFSFVQCNIIKHKYSVDIKSKLQVYNSVQQGNREMKTCINQRKRGKPVNIVAVFTFFTNIHAFQCLVQIDIFAITCQQKHVVIFSMRFDLIMCNHFALCFCT